MTIQPFEAEFRAAYMRGAPSIHEEQSKMTFPYKADILVGNRRDLDKQLDLAVGKAIEQRKGRHAYGIRVTRHEHRNFTVQTTDEIPFETIIERDMRQHRHESA